MSNLSQLSPSQLRQAAALKEKIVAMQKQLEQILGGSSKATTDTAAVADAPKATRRKMSAAARAKISAAAKARWAKVRAAKK
jgi:hypothetical protein